MGVLAVAQIADFFRKISTRSTDVGMPNVNRRRWLRRRFVCSEVPVADGVVPAIDVMPGNPTNLRQTGSLRL